MPHGGHGEKIERSRQKAEKGKEMDKKPGERQASPRGQSLLCGRGTNPSLHLGTLPFWEGLSRDIQVASEFRNLVPPSPRQTA